MSTKTLMTIHGPLAAHCNPREAHQAHPESRRQYHMDSGAPQNGRPTISPQEKGGGIPPNGRPK